jgi:predicted MFS family arabinose efflux permease
VNRFKETFRSLGVRNFRLFFFGQVVSASGTWMQRVGQAWLVFQLTNSGVILGITAALQNLPTLLVGPWGGLIADRVNKRRLLLITQTSAGVLALLLGVLTATGWVRLWMVLVLALALGCIDALDRPARSTFIVEMVGPDKLTNAITLNSVVMNAARTVGPAIGGVLIATAGLATNFFVNSLSYLAVIVGLLMMRPHELSLPIPAKRANGQLRDGWREVRANPYLFAPLMLMTVVGVLALEWTTTLPLLASDALSGDASTFGTLLVAMGVGAVVGGLLLAGSLPANKKALLTTAFIFSGFLIVVALAPSFPTVIVALLLLGASNICFKSVTTTMLQLRAKPEMRGRVMALYAVAVAGTTPIGAPFVGWLGETFGSRVPFWVAGACCAMAAAVVGLYLRRHPTTPDTTTSDVREATESSSAA